mmetsp:Transcript_28465/g.25295  ORF Transcript_28465/g.25295 Transcript_28465/m.25295 type:complete len:231 (+) Transcript_28465:1905-2597(+)
MKNYFSDGLQTLKDPKQWAKVGNTPHEELYEKGLLGNKKQYEEFQQDLAIRKKLGQNTRQALRAISRYNPFIENIYQFRFDDRYKESLRMENTEDLPEDLKEIMRKELPEAKVQQMDHIDASNKFIEIMVNYEKKKRVNDDPFNYHELKKQRDEWLKQNTIRAPLWVSHADAPDQKLVNEFIQKHYSNKNYNHLALIHGMFQVTSGEYYQQIDRKKLLESLTNIYFGDVN